MSSPLSPAGGAGGATAEPVPATAVEYAALVQQAPRTPCTHSLNAQQLPITAAAFENPAESCPFHLPRQSRDGDPGNFCNAHDDAEHSVVSEHGVVSEYGPGSEHGVVGEHDVISDPCIVGKTELDNHAVAALLLGLGRLTAQKPHSARTSRTMHQGVGKVERTRAARLLAHADTATPVAQDAGAEMPIIDVVCEMPAKILEAHSPQQRRDDGAGGPCVSHDDANAGIEHGSAHGSEDSSKDGSKNLHATGQLNTPSRRGARTKKAARHQVRSVARTRTSLVHTEPAAPRVQDVNMELPIFAAACEVPAATCTAHPSQDDAARATSVAHDAIQPTVSPSIEHGIEHGIGHDGEHGVEHDVEHGSDHGIEHNVENGSEHGPEHGIKHDIEHDINAGVAIMTDTGHANKRNRRGARTNKVTRKYVRKVIRTCGSPAHAELVAPSTHLPAGQ